MKNSILIVDDEPNIISSLKRILFDEDYEILTAYDGIEGLNVMKQHNKIKLVISDEYMPRMSGSEFLSRVKEIYPETIRIILTGHASLEAAMNAVNNGEVYRFFSKPWNEIELKLEIRLAIERYNIEEMNRRILKTVRHQAVDLKLLEMKYPDITKIERDERGYINVPEITHHEFSEIIEECEKIYLGEGFE